MADPISLSAIAVSGVEAASGAAVDVGATAAAGTAAAAGGTSAVGGLGMASTILGGITGAIGKLFGGESDSAAAKYQAAIAAQRAEIDKSNANYAIEVGEVQAQRAGMEGRFEEGKQVVGAAQGNIDVKSGSSLATQTSTTAITQQNEAVIRADAMKKAYNYQVQGAEDTATSNLYEMASKKDITAGEIGAAGSLLGTAGTVASQWLKGGRAGAGVFDV